MKLCLDYETRSEADLKKVGQWAYAEHPSTEIICAAVKVNNEAPRLWVSPYFEQRLPDGHGLPLLTLGELAELLNAADEIEAHNAPFEISVAKCKATPVYGWPEIQDAKWRCSLAKCAMHALPLSLDAAAEALGLAQKKDKAGYALMLKMCKPRRPSKTNPAKYWETPEQIRDLCRYCLQDVEVEHAISQTLDDLPEGELAVWRLDQRINERGVQADLDLAQRMVDETEEFNEKLTAEIHALTGGEVDSVRQVAAGLSWLKSQGADLENLQKATVEAALSNGISGKARRFLEIRQMLSKSSVAKYEGILRRSSDDGRLRGSFLYHGASTGRWSGRGGVQLQNLPRGAFSDVDNCITALGLGGFSFIEDLWGDPMMAASTCIRSALIAAPGHDLICADFSSIEARVNAWIADEQSALEAFVSGKDLYKTAAEKIFGVAYEDVSKGQRQCGKCSELALGYGGGIGAYAAMAKGYGVDLETLPEFVLTGAVDAEVKERAEEMAKKYVAKNPDSMSLEAAQACDVIKQLWRMARPRIVTLWRQLEACAVNAVSNPGKTFPYRNAAFRLVGDFLCMRLPSKRLLYYYKPEIKVVETPWGDKKAVIHFWGTDSQRGDAWARRHTHGGVLCENLVQATSRDLLAEAMLRVEAAGYPIVLHVHDEIVSEIPEGFGSLEDFEKTMAEVPSWAAGCPIAAEGWRGRRYRK